MSDKVSAASKTMKGLTVGIPDLSGIPRVYILIVPDAAEKASDTFDKVSALSDMASDRVYRRLWAGMNSQTQMFR